MANEFPKILSGTILRKLLLSGIKFVSHNGKMFFQIKMPKLEGYVTTQVATAITNKDVDILDLNCCRVALGEDNIIPTLMLPANVKPIIESQRKFRQKGIEKISDIGIENGGENDLLLIPVIRRTCQGVKFGLMNSKYELVVEPQYDIIIGDCRKRGDLIKVGNRYQIQYKPDGQIYDKIKWGVMDSNGCLITDLCYASIVFSDDNKLLTLQRIENGGYEVIDIAGNSIVPPKEYEWIDGFDKGLSRVIKDGKWGIIDDYGTEVLPVVYGNIWNFYKKNRLSTTAMYNGEEVEIELHNLNPEIPPLPIKWKRRNDESCDNVEYWDKQTYEDYNGTYVQDVEGWSDQMIGDALDGEPDAYWNID